jgi:glycosyltransferase involved in cell wall biosynthesis
VEYGWAMLAAFVLSLFIFMRDGFDTLHAHNPPDTFVLLAVFYKLFGTRFIFDHHDLSPEMYDARFPGRGQRLVRWSLLRLERWSCRCADHVIATNESYKRLTIERHSVPMERITVVRNGPALDRLKPTTPALGLRQPGKIMLGYAGTMGVQDGVDCLLRAVRHLVHDVGRTDFTCVLIGAGDAVPALKALAAQLEIDSYLHFTGWVEPGAIASYLSAMDVCVAPEPSNAYNDRSTVIKIMEYMALAKPIVAFDLPEHRYSAQAAAVYVRPNDELAFARALAELMDDPVRRQALGALGRHRVETELAWQYSAPRLLEAYRAVAGAVRHKRGTAYREDRVSRSPY